MNYPHAIATGNAVIAAADRWFEAREAYTDLLAAVSPSPVAYATARLQYEVAIGDLEHAVRAHLAATAVEHTVTPKEAGD